MKGIFIQRNLSLLYYWIFSIIQRILIGIINLWFYCIYTDQTDQTDQIRSDFRSDQIGPDQISDQIRSGQVKTDQIRSDQIIFQIRSDFIQI